MTISQLEVGNIDSLMPDMIKIWINLIVTIGKKTKQGPNKGMVYGYVIWSTPKFRFFN